MEIETRNSLIMLRREARILLRLGASGQISVPITHSINNKNKQVQGAALYHDWHRGRRTRLT